MYDALKRGRDILITACETTLSGTLATVSASHNVSVPAPRSVYRATEARPMYPNVEVSPPRGVLQSLSKGNIVTTADYWLIANLQSSDLLWLDDACMAYITALVRMLSDMDGSAYLCDPIEFDFSPPMFTDDTTQKRSVGVLCRFQMAEGV